jgi:hypothetical protein
VRQAIGYIPILTTILSLLFGTNVLRRYRARPHATHLLWWAIGIYTYGLGTFTESYVTLLGWNPVVFRMWYITGALMGGAPLATGSVYFHLERRIANIITTVVVAYIAVAAFFVCIVPIHTELVEAHRLTGKVMAWPWVRLFSPFVNLYAVIFLIGGAVVSALQASRDPGQRDRAVGNTLIATGAILPGIGGAFTRMGYTEVLYVGEFLGIILIWIGYRLCTR